MSLITACLLTFLVGSPGVPATSPHATSNDQAWPADLPVYDHVVIVIEENKDYDDVVGNADAPNINSILVKEGANLTRMFGEEHHSEGNYFWLFAGNRFKLGYNDQIPKTQFPDSNLGSELDRKFPGIGFKGYAEDLPSIGFTGEGQGLYARKHVPWISFSQLDVGTDPATSCNLSMTEFATAFQQNKGQIE